MHSDIKELLETERVHQAEERLIKIRDFFTITYPNLGGTKDQRDREISSYEQWLCLEVMGPLSSPKYSLSTRLVCLPAWMVAASLHMAILQERAILTPNSGNRSISLFC